jgi:hypothetical protein
MTYRDKCRIERFRASALPGALMAAFLSTVLSACATAGVAVEHGMSGRGPASLEGCGLREISRQRLTAAGGRPLYVEADAFVANGRGEVLLAGTPNYLWKISPQDEIVGLTADSILGAVIARDGTARLVPAPMDPKRIRGIRAAARPDGGWDVVFADVPADSSSSAGAERLWYTAYDGSRWSALEPLPVPSDVALSPTFTSSLVRRGDTLAWALTPAMRQGRRDISLFQRVGGRWTHETVPTTNAADVDLAHSDSLGFVLAVVQPDLRLQEADGNSLLLWTRQPDWRIARRLVHGRGEGRVHAPSLVRTSGGLLATWWTPVGEGPETRNELRARYVGPPESSEPVIMLDPNVPFGFEMSPVSWGAGVPLWVSEHQSAETGQGEPGEIRYVSVAGRQPFEVARTPNPYRMRSAAAISAPGELLVTGMEYRESRFAFSLLLRARSECERAA